MVNEYENVSIEAVQPEEGNRQHVVALLCRKTESCSVEGRTRQGKMYTGCATGLEASADGNKELASL